MALWLNRAGSKGEYESKFLEDKRIYLTWDNMDRDLRSFTNKKNLYSWYESFYGVTEKTSIQYSNQLWKFVKLMKEGDIVVLPSKRNSTIHFGLIKSKCIYDDRSRGIYKHYRDVDWIKKDVPKTKIDQDLLYSFGAFSTICNISRNNAEKRIKEFLSNEKMESTPTLFKEHQELDNIEENAKINISKYISRRFKGYKMQNLIAEIFEAKGFTTHVPSEGADDGVDILVGKGDFGFEKPFICVQVKTTENPVGKDTLDRLIGTMSNYGADYGILVSWNGFKNTVENVRSKQFFKVKLWDESIIIKEILENYDGLSEEYKSQIPLKRIWTLTKEANQFEVK